MNRSRVHSALRGLLNGCLSALLAIVLADLLISLVQRDTPGWLEAAALANQYWPLTWQYDYVHWLYTAYIFEALVIGLVGGLLAYWKAYDRIRPQRAW